MLFKPNLRDTCRAVADAIDIAEEATPALMRAALDIAAVRCATPDRAARLKQIDALIAAHAWTDAALAIAALDHAQAVRRIVRDDTEWYCTIGSQWPVPEWLDHGAWHGHPALPLAILGAVVDAVSQTESAAPAETSWAETGRDVPRRDHGDVVASFGCDNYS